MVAGALAVDFSCDYSPLPGTFTKDLVEPVSHTSNPATTSQSLGGVAHNIAKAAYLMGASVRLCSAIGDDFSGHAALKQLQSEGMRADGIKVFPRPHRTAQYVAVNNANKDLTLAMADMSILESDDAASIEESWLSSFAQTGAKCLIIDANWSPQALHSWLRYGKANGALTAFEPVSTAKATRLFTTPSSTDPSALFPNHLADIATPNALELSALYETADRLELFNLPGWFRIIDALGIPSSGLRTALAVMTSPDLVDRGIPQESIKLLPFIPIIITKLGPRGVLLTKLLPASHPALHSSEEAPYILSRCRNEDQEIGGLYMRLFEPERILGPGEVVSVNGVGDTFLGALATGLIRGKRVEEVVPLAQRAAALSLKSKQAVSEELKGLRAEVERL